MSVGSHRRKVDTSQAGIIAALRKAGICAHSTAALGEGFPDICWGFRGVTGLLEVKTGERPSDRKLTGAEENFRANWGGHLSIVSTPEEAICAVLNHAKLYGKI
jgi:hypothetical protein